MKLIEGEDYVIENGLYVFTRSYLLKRGHCCHSGCRNCPYPKARIVSMVPSWTETLLAAGADVVGRTRFCVHPESEVHSIPVVGGTKDIKWEKIKDLNPDFLLLDKEENPLSMFEESPVKTIVTHVKGVVDVASEIDKITSHLGGSVVDALKKLSRDWRELAAPGRKAALRSWDELPGIREWIKKPEIPLNEAKLVYVIWKNPWMSISPSTFIASMLEQVGIEKSLLLSGDEPGVSSSTYPSFEPERLSRNTVFLFSTEPYPFHKKKEGLKEMGHASAIIEGESFSWFGLRSLEFLKEHLHINRDDFA